MSAPITASVAAEVVPTLPVAASGDTASNGDTAGQFASAITDALPVHGQGGGKPPAKHGADDAAALADPEALLATLLPMPTAVGPQSVPAAVAPAKDEPSAHHADAAAIAAPSDVVSQSSVTAAAEGADAGAAPVVVDATANVLAQLTTAQTAAADPIDVPTLPAPSTPHGKSGEHPTTPQPLVGAAHASDTAALHSAVISAARQSAADASSSPVPDEPSVAAVDADQPTDASATVPATTEHAAQPASQQPDAVVPLPAPAVELRTSAVDRPADPSPASVQIPPEQPVLGLELARLRNRGDGTHELTVSLHPAELGQVGVTATVRDGALTVTVACADHVAHDAVRAALPTLHHELQRAGFTGVDVALDHRGAQPDRRAAHPQPDLPDLPASAKEHAEAATDAARLRRRPSSDVALDRWL